MQPETSTLTLAELAEIYGLKGQLMNGASERDSYLRVDGNGCHHLAIKPVMRDEQGEGIFMGAKIRAAWDSTYARDTESKIEPILPKVAVRILAESYKGIDWQHASADRLMAVYGIPFMLTKYDYNQFCEMSKSPEEVAVGLLVSLGRDNIQRQANVTRLLTHFYSAKIRDIFFDQSSDPAPYEKQLPDNIIYLVND